MMQMTFSGLFDAETWRRLTGCTVCESCGTPVALFTVCEEDHDGWPIEDRPTGEKRWVEMADPPRWGEDHTPERCRELADRLTPTVVPAVLDELGGWPVVTPALRPGLL